MTLAATVRGAAARFGHRVAFVDPDGRTLSYTDLDARSSDVAAGMAARCRCIGERSINFLIQR